MLTQVPPLGARPWVAYVVPFAFPWGQAGSRRVEGISRSLTSAGRDVLVVALPPTGEPGSHEIRTLRVDEETGATVRRVTRAPHPQNAWLRQIDYHVSGLRKALRLVDEAAPSPPTHLIVYGTVATPTDQALRWGQARRVPVVLDVVERLSARQFGIGAVSPGFASASVGFRRVAPRASGVIAISRHIERFFTDRGVPTVRIPPTTSVTEIEVGQPAPGPRTFGYFGSPGRKDLLDVVTRAYLSARSANPSVSSQLVVAGPGTKEALSQIQGWQQRGVRALGNLPPATVMATVGSVHATVLARPDARYAHAGYPTKVVESLSVGTPVICNLTSDLADVVVEGQTGWVAASPSVRDLAEAVSRAMTAPEQLLVAMRQSARHVAEATYDPALYSSALSGLLDAVGSLQGNQ